MVGMASGASSGPRAMAVASGEGTGRLGWPLGRAEGTFEQCSEKRDKFRQIPELWLLEQSFGGHRLCNAGHLQRFVLMSPVPRQEPASW